MTAIPLYVAAVGAPLTVGAIRLALRRRWIAENSPAMHAAYFATAGAMLGTLLLGALL
jgi:hypothetical protein